ncbi:MAG: excinuclease ABC subunit UvrA [Gracilibacteraceae bacterium]|jgi:excinuclease ABC subunit A|nr:excinuclease ABC subunit UvrA [Gracilibacteraceae bacterium]
MEQEFIKVRGARVHNLKNIDVDIPRNKLVVITGLSGSGKSSLAFDTIYAEGQRRYVESLSAYARQFLGQMNKPDVDYIEGLSPAISIDQKTTSKNPRSTVGTVTEVYDYLRLLYARVGHPHCPRCGKPITRQTVQQMTDQVLELTPGSRVQILAPVVRGQKGEQAKVLDMVKRNGYTRLRVDGEMRGADEEIRLAKNKKHSIEVIIDRLRVKAETRPRLAESLETALRLGEGLVLVDTGQEDVLFSENFACPDCGVALEELSPRSFSFNSPFGACPDCTGLGASLEADIDLIIPDRSMSLNEGAIVPWAHSSADYYRHILAEVAKAEGFSLDTPLNRLTKAQWQALVYGSAKEIVFSYSNIFEERKVWRAPFEGLVRYFNRRYRDSASEYVKNELMNYMVNKPCQTCGGKRLRPEVLAVTVGGLSIEELTRQTVKQNLDFFAALALTAKEKTIAHQVLKEITARLGFLVNVGLDYLTLGRAAGSLSGGEAQRIRLATQIGSGLTGVLYVLDEPSIGLHQRDNARLLSTLAQLRDQGNTLLVVEHDEDTMYHADHIIDIGPAAGLHGGLVVAQGTPEQIRSCPDSITGQYLRGDKSIAVPTARRPSNGKWLRVLGAAEHNLHAIDAAFPLGSFICVTGVSGSGKSTLVNEVLYKALLAELRISHKVRPGRYARLEGLEYVDKVVAVDQSPIGRTPRSNPATYTGVFDLIRTLFAQTQEARLRGYKPGRFSFKVKGGRCEACHGDGIIKIEMHFLPDVYVPCEVCGGKRYNRESLEIAFKGKNIAQVLDMTVDEAVDIFAAIPKIARKMETLRDVGLGYIRLGQPATTLSGGEAQRIKLATYLSRRSTGKTLFILDEPTTGLHIADVAKLLEVLHRFVDAGDTVLVIEHNLDVIKTADYLIDLGPEGGNRGGHIVACGTPEAVTECPDSYTGQFLRRRLGRDLAP